MRRLLLGDFTIKRFIRSVILIYLFFAAYIFVAADGMIFLPPPASYSDTQDLIKFAGPNDAQISALYLPTLYLPGLKLPALQSPTPEQTAGENRGDASVPYTVLYSHGNAEDLGLIRPTLVTLQSAGLSIFAYDYPGYGTSTGKPSERSVYQTIDAAYTYLTETLQVPPEKVIVYGRSVGGGPSTHLAARKAIAALILESTFTSAFRTVVPWSILPFDKFPNARNLKRFDGPTLIIHGTEDQTIAFKHGERLLNIASGPKRFLAVQGAGHNDVVWVAGDRYLQTIQEFVQIVTAHLLP